MEQKTRESVFFRLVLASSIALLITVLGMIAAAFAPTGSLLAQFFDREGLRLLGVEVLGILGFGILAVMFDRPEAPEHVSRSTKDETSSPS